MSFKPEQKLSVTLRAEQWNQVLALLADGPYRVVNPLIVDVQMQLMSQEPERERVVPWRPQPSQPESA
jgi:hypothetical protein